MLSTPFISHSPHLPRLWLKRLALYESFSPGANIRSIPFKKGLNLIVGEDAEGGEGNLGGHSVGKTTLCRLIRHCLGEPTFATPEDQDAIRDNFPHGWVGCEVEIDGTLWSVLLPFVRTSKDVPLAASVDSLEDLFTLEKAENCYQDYLNALEKLMPSNLSHLKWKHLLAWLARDQNSIQGGYWGWRAGESQSGTALPRKYADRAFLCRVVAGLSPDDEDEIREALTRANEAISTAENKKIEAEQAPRDQQRNALRILGSHFKFKLPEPKVGVLLPGLLVQKFFAEREDKIALAQEEHQMAQRAVSNCTNLMLQSLQEAQTNSNILTHKTITLESMASEAAGKEIYDADLAAIIAVIEKNPTCPANIPAADCKEVQALRKAYEDKTHGIVDKFSAMQENSAYARLQETVSHIEKKRDEAMAKYKEFVQEKPTLKKKEQETYKNMLTLCREQEFLQDQWKALQESWAILNLNADNPPARDAIDELKRQVEIKTNLESRLAQLWKTLEVRANSLSKVLSELAWAVTDGVCTGKIKPEKTTTISLCDRNKQLTRGALEVLTIVLADMTCMLTADHETSKHPGFLVHDSPRSVDMSDRFYAHILQQAAKLTADYGGEDAASFQYIVTTTTPPPAELTPFVKERLASSPESMLLFKNRLLPRWENL